MLVYSWGAGQMPHKDRLSLYYARTPKDYYYPSGTEKDALSGSQRVP